MQIPKSLQVLVKDHEVKDHEVKDSSETSTKDPLLTQLKKLTSDLKDVEVHS